MTDNVNHPSHYTGFSNGAEVLDITENLSFNLGNVVKYVARAGRKTVDPFEDLRKAKFYLDREINRLIEDSDESVFELSTLAKLPIGLYPIEGLVFEDKDGDEWRFVYNEGWQYRAGKNVGWIPIVGDPSESYGPFKERSG